jgi:hypothetical protein
MAERATGAYTVQKQATMVELRTRPADRKSWCRSSSTYSRTWLQRSALGHPNAFRKRAHQQSHDSSKPWLNCEPTQQSKELELETLNLQQRSPMAIAGAHSLNRRAGCVAHKSGSVRGVPGNRGPYSARQAEVQA